MNLIRKITSQAYEELEKHRSLAGEKNQSRETTPKMIEMMKLPIEEHMNIIRNEAQDIERP